MIGDALRTGALLDREVVLDPNIVVSYGSRTVAATLTPDLTVGKLADRLEIPQNISVQAIVRDGGGGTVNLTDRTANIPKGTTEVEFLREADPKG